MENRNGLFADVFVNAPNGAAEWDGALAMLDRQVAKAIMPMTLGADARYDVQRFVDAVRARGITPHIAQTRDVRRSHESMAGRHGIQGKR